MQQNPIGRIAYLDVLRIIATFAVVMGHVAAKEYYSSYESHNWYVALIYDSLIRWSVPIFVMISGSLFLNPGRAVTTKDLLTKNIPRLLLAYVFWWAFYSGFDIYRFSINGRPFTYIFLYPHMHLWFLPMLMCMYLLVPILRKVSVDLKVVRYALIVWLVYIAVGFFLSLGVVPGVFVKQIENLFCLDAIIGYAGYFLLGYYLTQVSFSKRKRRVIYLLGLLGAAISISGGIIMSHIDGEASTVFLDNVNLRVVAVSSALFIGVKANAHRIGRMTTSIISYVRKDLFGIYLTHAFWLIVLNKSAFRNLCDQAITLPIIAIVIFVCSLFTTKLIRLIPILRKVVE